MNSSDASVLDLLLDFPAPSRGEIRKWPQELKNQRKMELHNKRMSRFRDRKANEMKSMQEELHRLEQELEKRIGELRHEGVSRGLEGVLQVQGKLRQLVLEREDLREESVALRQEIARYLKFHQAIQGARSSIATFSTGIGEQMNDVTVRFVDWKWQLVQEEAGRWVHFPNGAPSFFFYPFSRLEFDNIIHQHALNTSMDSTNMNCFGQFLGWNVYHAATRPATYFSMNHARFSKRVNRSFDNVRDTMNRPDGTRIWPILPTARDVGLDADIHIQNLQQLNDNSSVNISDASGHVSNRCLTLTHQSECMVIKGKRVFKFYYVVGDSEANCRSRKADPLSQDQVCWVTDDRGYSLTLTEVDEMAVDVKFDSVACLSDDQHALNHFIMFGQIATRWEQQVVSSRLLKASTSSL